jgi:hypothetical protein
MLIHKLYKPKKSDREGIEAYVSKSLLENCIDDVKLVWDSEENRPESAWEGLAIRFKPNITVGTYNLIGAIVELHADEYWGEQDGYHIFWFD